MFTITGFARGATCTAGETGVPDGYEVNAEACRAVPISRGRAAACTIINTRTPPGSVTFTVTKDFRPDEPDLSVSISLACTSGTTDAPQPATEGTPAVFTVRGFEPGATCTASEGDAPAGYTGDERDCRAVAIPGRRSCTITDTITKATFAVAREFEDGNTSSVAVALACDSGTVEPATATARADSPAAFTVTGYTAGATCTATTVKAPTGYDRSESACRNVSVDARECTIVYTIPG